MCWGEVFVCLMRAWCDGGVVVDWDMYAHALWDGGGLIGVRV